MALSLARVCRLMVCVSVALATSSTVSAQFADVQELAFVRDSQIFRVRSDGTGLLQLTGQGVNSEPAWSPDGTRIASYGIGTSTS